MFRALFSLPRSVWLLGLVSLVNDSASELVYPLVPLYLSGVLMAGPRVLGLIEGVAEAMASLLKLWAGVMVDRSGRSKPWVVAGYGLAGLARPLIAFVTRWPMLLALRLADRMAKAVRAAPRDALLAAHIAPGQRGPGCGRAPRPGWPSASRPPARSALRCCCRQRSGRHVSVNERQYLPANAGSPGRAGRAAPVTVSRFKTDTEGVP